MEMTKIDENIQTAKEMLSGMVERCYELEEENKKLKEENEKLKYENISLHIELEEIKDDGELSYEEKLLYE